MTYIKDSSQYSTLRVIYIIINEVNHKNQPSLLTLLHILSFLTLPKVNPVSHVVLEQQLVMRGP